MKNFRPKALTARTTPWILILATGASILGQSAVVRQTAPSYTPGSTLSVTNSFTYNGQLLSLLWRPQLPPGWKLQTVSGDGNPESMQGEIVWTGGLPASPIKMIYSVAVPGTDTGSKVLSAEVEYQLSTMLNPANELAQPNPLTINEAFRTFSASAGHQTAPTYSSSGLLSVTNRFEYSGQLLSLLWHPRLPVGWSLQRVSGDGSPEIVFGEIVWTGSLPASPINMVYVVAVPAGEAGSRAIRAEVEYQLPNVANPIADVAQPSPLTVNELPHQSQVSISHETALAYSAAGLLNVTNRFAYSGGVLSLLWRPRLPHAWKLQSVSGDGNPEIAFGEIVWTGTLPSSPMNMIYSVAVPPGETGPKIIQAEVEYQLAGKSNPESALALPETLGLKGGTSEDDSVAQLRLISGSFLTNRQFRLQLAGPMGRQYLVEASTNLINWIPLGTNLLSTELTDFVDGDASRWSRRFYRGALLPARGSEEQAAIIDDGEEFPLDSFGTVILSPFLPDKLIANTPISVGIETIGGVGQRLPLSGTLQLSLATSNGGPAPFDYSISPSTLILTNGIALAQITIATQGNLGDVFLAAEPFQKSQADIRKAAVIPGVKQVFNYFPPKDHPWIHPLPRPNRVTGTYGEWPGHTSIHRGVDLATAPGTDVRAVARGKVGFKSGEWLAILHGNGVTTRYGHITPRADLVVGKSTVEQGDLIGVVRTGDHPHLHFELRRNQKAQECDNKFCGVSENPVFLLPSLASGDTDFPEINAVYFRNANPAKAAVTSNEPFGVAFPGGPFVIMKCLDRDYRGGTFSAELAPTRVTFRPENGKPAAIVFSDSKTVDGFFQKEAIPGYAKLPGTTDKEKAQHRYQFWFNWDTASYADQPVGARSIDIDLGDAAGNSRSQHFEFGPKILDKSQLANVTAPTFEVHVQAKLGPLPQPITQSQVLDTITPMIDTSGLVRGTASLEGNAAWDVTQHNASHKFLVRLSDTADGFLVFKAPSTLLPNIADEVRIQVKPKDDTGSWAGTWTGQHQYSGQGSTCFYSGGGNLGMTITVNGNSFSGTATFVGIQIREVSPATCKILGSVNASGNVSGTISSNAISGTFDGNYASATFGNSTLPAGRWPVSFQGTRNGQSISGTVLEGASKYAGQFSLSK